jgi:2-oxoglutarate dehydrogenase E1 component
MSDQFSIDEQNKYGQNAGYVAELYDLYRSNPGSVGEQWRLVFESGADGTHVSESVTRVAPESDKTPAHQKEGRAINGNGHGVHLQNGIAGKVDGVTLERQGAVGRYIEAFRNVGHFAAHVIPLSHDIYQIPVPAELDIANYPLDFESDASAYYVDGFQGSRSLTIAEIVRRLKATYCGSIGFEWAHVTNREARQWLQEKIEGTSGQIAALSSEERKLRLKDVMRASLFESELHRKYIGVKRFSLEGGEAFIPMLETVLSAAGSSEVMDIIIGMAHRGRLNLLTQVMRRPLHEVLLQFDDRTLASIAGAGDVKYHLGYESVRVVKSGHATVGDREIGLRLAPNPSHLEAVNPVVEGIARAIQDTQRSGNRRSVLPILVHGDAAFAGQGVVFETLNYARVSGFATGGTLHIVINNQIGFTTTPDESRSTPYCTDFAKALGIPIFHVNGEDIDAVCRVARLATEYRNQFASDVVIDLNCYRKHGHNEGDDPSYTQPLSTKEIKEKKNVATLYADRLQSEGVVSAAEVQQIVSDYRAEFEAAYQRTRDSVPGDACHLYGRMRSQKAPSRELTNERLVAITEAMSRFPAGFTPHPKLKVLMEKRTEAGRSSAEIDWGFAEALAFGSLLQEGYSVRLCGQDCRRGTFSHRHAVLDDFVNEGEIYAPLSTVCGLNGEGSKAQFEVINSTLSEEAVVGFEFGYSSIARNALVLWEAQFGDFVNGAQIQIDQFIASSDSKWDQQSGLVLLLPHGYEGQGPEHSSARLERFLQLCAEQNMEVCVPTTGHQYFSLLRRQMLRSVIVQRPLIIMTPKSLLRSADASSPFGAFTDDTFQEVIIDTIGDTGARGAAVLCSGKVYYDVIKALKAKGDSKATVFRIEQLYPFPVEKIAEALKEGGFSRFIWVQEEPRNQGAWSFVDPILREECGVQCRYVGRPASAATAVGSSSYSAAQLKEMLADLLEVMRG